MRAGQPIVAGGEPAGGQIPDAISVRLPPNRKCKREATVEASQRRSRERSTAQIPEPIRTIAEPTLAQVDDATAIVLFGSRARGDAEERSDWDLMVRSHALLPHNLMVLEGIVAEDARVGGCGTIQCVSLSDHEAANHTAEDGSLAVAWSREGTVIAGEDPLLGRAARKELNMNERTLAERNNAALTKIVHAWTTLCTAHGPRALPPEETRGPRRRHRARADQTR